VLHHCQGLLAETEDIGQSPSPSKGEFIKIREIELDSVQLFGPHLHMHIVQLAPSSYYFLDIVGA